MSPSEGHVKITDVTLSQSSSYTNPQPADSIKTPTTFAEFAEACSQQSSNMSPKAPSSSLLDTKHDGITGYIKTPTTFAEFAEACSRHSTNEKNVKRKKTKRRIKMSPGDNKIGQVAHKQGANTTTKKKKSTKSPNQKTSKKTKRDKSKRTRTSGQCKLVLTPTIE